MTTTAPTRVAKEVDVSTLALHPLIQRFRHEEKPIQREERVSWLVANWNPAALERITCIPRDDGAFFVCAGGHRTEAARRMGLPTLPADVIYGLNGDGERALVAAILDQETGRQWTRLGKALLARSVGLDPDAAIDTLLRRFGPGIEPQASTGFVCVDKLLKAYEMGTLEVTAKIINGAWPEDPSARTGLMVESIARFSAFYGSAFEPAALIEKLSKRHCRSLQMEATAKGRALRRSSVVELVGFLADIYNHGRKNRLPAYEPGRGFKK